MSRLRITLTALLIGTTLVPIPARSMSVGVALREGATSERAARARRMVAGAPMIRIPAGSFRPLYGKPGDGPLQVAAFSVDRDPVTRGQFLQFVRERAEWQRSRVAPLFADRRGYLADWSNDTSAGAADDLRRPVSGVSWFAARAYCAARGRRLPTAAEWEYIASSNATARDAMRDQRNVQHLVTLYATRRLPLTPVDQGETNAYGVRALHDIAWEWVADFNSVLVSDDSRGVGGRDHDMFCASAAIGAPDPTNYPAFLRYALRAGLKGRSTLETLGFRCAA